MIRIGHGYDVHRLVETRKLILGGVEIPFEKGLDGYSDADVLTHAVIDSILGALALGDIGKHFPDTDPAYKDADSLVLLAQCCDKMRQMGYRLGNLDATIIAQQPKLASWLPKMQENLANVLSCLLEQINIKATTEETLGFTGQGLGISAHCVCLLEQE